MSFFGELFGGQEGGAGIYTRDFRNAYRFRPDVNPARHAFQGYVNFVFNRDEKLFGALFNGGDASSTEFRTTISSLVKTADLPGVQFQTETLNSYNRKRIVNTGINYDPVNFTVHDTIGNEWLTVLMKYFSYHYMDPRNKQNGDSRDLGARIVEKEELFGSNFGFNNPNASYDSNLAGYNTNYTAKFFERIDYVLYHGQKAVQYSIFNPVMTMFKPSPIDYADSGLRDFQMSFEYERFTIFNKVNFTLSDEDRDRFEGVDNLTDVINSFVVPSLFEPDNGILEETSLKETELSILGDAQDRRNRTGQIQPEPPLPSEPDSGGTAFLPDTYGDSVAVEIEKPDGGDGSSALGDLIGDVVDSAIGAAISGGNIKDAALGTAVRRVAPVIGRQINDAINNEGG